jgi:hypothetical protein
MRATIESDDLVAYDSDRALKEWFCSDTDTFEFQLVPLDPACQRDVFNPAH